MIGDTVEHDGAAYRITWIKWAARIDEGVRLHRPEIEAVRP